MKYSVIIPVYNAERTITRCVDSLLCQEYHDAEIILINDGSTDRSHEFCQKYASTNPRILYIRKENGGVSSARNAGLDAASGEYVLFVDSDDYVVPHYFAELDTIDPQLDYVIFSWYLDYGDKVLSHIYEDSDAYSEDAFFEKMSRYICRKRTISPWNKRYKRSIIENYHVRFHDKLSIGEDGLFNVNYLLHCSSYRTMSNRLCYINLENDLSLSRKIRKDLSEQLTVGYLEMRKHISSAGISQKHKNLLISAINYLNLCDIYSEAKRMHKNDIALPSRLKSISQICADFHYDLADLPRTVTCLALWIPVKLRLSVLIDLVGWILSRK